jgi:hypothetical protein
MSEQGGCGCAQVNPVVNFLISNFLLCYAVLLTCSGSELLPSPQNPTGTTFLFEAGLFIWYAQMYIYVYVYVCGLFE